jgi:magnesium transporter
VISVFLHRNGVTSSQPAVDPTWLAAGSDAVVWVDFSKPSADELRVLADVFHFHPLAIEDAVAARHHPKIEHYGTYLYLILHGIDFRASQHRFSTHDTDFFLGPNYLVTIHDGQTRTIPSMHDLCVKNDRLLAEGPVGLMHRIVDAMVDHYRPEVEKLAQKLDQLEEALFESPDRNVMREILALKRDIVSLRRVTLPQRDAIARLARREFTLVSDEMAYRFRDVFDQLVRLADEGLLFQDRVASLLDAHLSNVSNRLNRVMKVLTVITTIFMPLTLLSGLWGMNVPLPHFPGGESAQFWWILGILMAMSAIMLGIFRRMRWL